MPRFDVTAPDGRTIEVTAPEGATKEQAIAYARANWATLTAAQEPKAAPFSLKDTAISGAQGVVGGKTVAVNQAEATPMRLEDTVLSSGVTAAAVGLMVGCFLWFVARWRWRKLNIEPNHAGKVKLESAKNLFFITLGINIAATSVVIAIFVWVLGILKDISSGVITPNPSLASKFAFLNSLSWVMFLTLLFVGFGLIKWLNACYRYAKEVIGATGFKQAGWTITAWITPIFNLFKPYQIINEIYKAGAPNYAIPDDWKKESGSSLLLTWWIVWVVTHFFLVTFSMGISILLLRDDISLQQKIGYIEFLTWLIVTVVINGLLWFVVAGSLTQRLLNRSSAVLVAPVASSHQAAPPPPSPPMAPSHQTTNFEQVASPVVTRNSTQPNPKPVVTTSDEEAIYEQALTELSTKKKPGLWAMALAQTANGGNPDGAYIALRVEQLRGERSGQRQSREHEALLLQERIKSQAANQNILDPITRFQNGVEPTSFDVKLLAKAATKDAQVALITDRIHGNNLLHWCALLGLDHEATTLLQHGADAASLNGDGQLPFQLARNISLAAVLKSAATTNPHGTCPNPGCKAVIPLTSQECLNCGASFRVGSSWKINPFKA